MELQASDIEIVLGDQLVLQRVSIIVKPGEFVGIIGPNGSGKSTLLKCIYRVLLPSHGVVLLSGYPLSAMSLRQSAQRMAVVAQHNVASFDFTVQEIVLMGRSAHKKMMERDHAGDYAIVRECLDKVGLAAFADRSFSTLSGGEQQRVMLARALAQKTSCLILDEPTNHLDIKYQLQLMDIVKASHLTVLAAMHDLNIAAMYCDKLFAMEDGKIVGSGTPEQLLTPDFIRILYGVTAKIVKDADTGKISIIYQAGVF
ncbi:MAG: ABC transporter ATP-binding protein [Sporomusa sp.]